MQKVIFPFDAELKAELDQIRLAIQANQNGVASRSMASTGYKLNYGVPYITLRQIAAEHKQNEKLADCLWNIGYRETMLIATLLYPADKLTLVKCQELCEDINEMELAEFACKNLMAKIKDANGLTIKLSASANEKSNIKTSTVLPYLIASWLIENGVCEENTICALNNLVGKDLESPSSHSAKAISCYLKQLSVLPKYAKETDSFLKQCESSDNICARWLAEEVKTFIEYH